MTEAKILNRIIELETTVAFLDDTVEQLNLTIAKQDAELAEQKRMLSMLIEKFIKTNGDSGIEHFDVIADKPPHY